MTHKALKEEDVCVWKMYEIYTMLGHGVCTSGLWKLVRPLKWWNMETRMHLSWRFASLPSSNFACKRVSLSLSFHEKTRRRRRRDEQWTVRSRTRSLFTSNWTSAADLFFSLRQTLIPKQSRGTSWSHFCSPSSRLYSLSFPSALSWSSQNLWLVFTQSQETNTTCSTSRAHKNLVHQQPLFSSSRHAVCLWTAATREFHPHLCCDPFVGCYFIRSPWGS